VAGEVIGKDSRTHNPICIIANYVIDTLCQDIFQVENGNLFEGLVSVGSTSSVSPDDPDIINHLSNEYMYRTVTSDYYSEFMDNRDRLHYSRILAWYKDYFSETDPSSLGASFLLPIGFLNAVRRISDFSSGVMIISGDKGSHNPDSFRGRADPHLAVHGSFSVMVNYHAIALYCKSNGGFVFHSDEQEAALQVSCFYIPAIDQPTKIHGDIMPNFNSEHDAASSFPILRQTFDDNVKSFGPNDFFILQKGLKEEANPSLASILGLLRLSGWVRLSTFRCVLLLYMSHAPYH